MKKIMWLSLFAANNVALYYNKDHFKKKKSAKEALDAAAVKAQKYLK